jgi:phenylacetate-CoA ligase
MLEAFPSVLGILADLLLQRGESVPMRAVFTDGEPLYPFLRAKIEQAFQAKVYDTYGNTELCGLIQECEFNQMHLIPEFAYLEILDDDNQPVPAGREGYFVWTALINDVMPLIRYRIGDRGCWQDSGPCACGRAFPTVVPTITRDSDLLRCPDGRILSPRTVNQLLKYSSSFRFCQFVQAGPSQVVVRAVANNGDGPRELSQVQQSLQALLGSQMNVGTELAAEPIVRAGGKIPLIVQRAS